MRKSKSAHILPAKLTTPKVDGATARHRLFQLLDRAREKPVIWLSAPAGSGKTTLVASYLARCKIKPLWYQVDARDIDPATCFAYLREVVTLRSRRKRETLPLLTPEYALGLPAFTLNFFEHLFSRLPKPAVLVFDNYQDLPSGSPLREMLPLAARALPDGVNIIFISRTDIPEDFAPLRVSRSLAHISADLMVLDDEEACQISNRIMGGTVADDKVVLLNRQAGGWLAGLILLLEGAEDLSNGEVINAMVFDYFAAEIMRKADLETQLFLAKCSLLPVMDAGTAAVLTGNPRAELILKNLVRRNYFISRLPGEVMRYEFHPLFRDYLREECCRLCADQEMLELKRRAGHILADQEEYVDAVELLSAAGAIDELVELVLARAEEMVAEGRYQTLAKWLEAIPETAYRQQPWLSYWHGVSLMPFEPHNAGKCFEQTYAAFESSRDVAGLYLSWAGIAESCTLQWDSFSHMHGWLEKFSVLNETYPDYPSPEIEAQVQYALYSVKVYIDPGNLDFQGTTERLLNSHFNADFRIKNGANLALFYSWSGKFQEMRGVMETLELLAETENISPLSQILIKVNRGTLYWLTGEPEQACDTIQEAIDIGRQSGVHIMDSYSYAQLLYAKGVMQDLDGMRQILELMKKHLLEHRRIDVAHYKFHMGWYRILTREYSASLEYMRQCMTILEDLSAQMPISLGSLGLARALIENGDYGAAATALDRSLQFSLATPSRHLQYLARMLEAYMYLRQEREDDAVNALSAALKIAASESEFWTFPLWDGEMVSELCALALRHEIEQDYVRSLIKKWCLSPPVNIPAADLWPWRIRIHTLGGFSLSIDDKPVKSSGKTLEMLKAIIALGGHDIIAHEISDRLWPDADGDQANRSFKVTLHRLRKLITQEALELHDGRLSLAPRWVWVDIWDIERNLDALVSVSDEELASLAQKAVTQYRGSFLPNENDSWVLSMRERLRSRFLRIIDMATERLIETGQSRVAINCYQGALEVDPLAERFYIGLMRCYFNHGEVAEGLAVYRRCQQTLATELEVAPCAETEKWHEMLRGFSSSS
jgi:ATP/maltotriose-dependent transcriptional regulator MalT/DNA-binding SARP family transcriptional activator